MGTFLAFVFVLLLLAFVFAWARQVDRQPGQRPASRRETSPPRPAGPLPAPSLLQPSTLLPRPQDTLLPHGTPRDPAAPLITPQAPPVGASTVPDGVPDHLPLRTKQYFLARSESAFLAALEASLPDGHRVFPNVRLNDLFSITAREYRLKQGTYARLRDKHVDFLIVSGAGYRPVLAIELDGASHDNAQQQYRDAVKDVAFRSAGLPLIRLRAEVAHTPTSLRAVLGQHLPAERVRA